MDFFELFNLQLSLFILIIVGLVLKRIGIIDNAGKRSLTELCLNVIIPCNIIKSFFVQQDASALRYGFNLVVIGFIIQGMYIFLNRFIYNKYPEKTKQVLQCAMVISMGGFLGNPVAESIFGDLGLLYASFFLISMRVAMWSIGPYYYIGKTGKKSEVIKKVLTHPCMVAIYFGLFIMFTGFKVPNMFVRAIKNIGACNSAITMIIIGTILADVDAKSIVSKTSLKYSFIRLFLMPLMALFICEFFELDMVARAVAVLMTAMPAGAGVAMFATKYDGDELFGTSLIVLTILLSVVTLPIWCSFLIV